VGLVLGAGEALAEHLGVYAEAGPDGLVFSADSSAAALRYQHVMTGRDAAIAAALDELIQAASTRSQDPAAAGSGTRLARTGRSGRKGQRR
jgi:hypothetical protein